MRRMNNVLRIIAIILCNLSGTWLSSPPDGLGIMIEVNDAVLTYGRVQGLIQHNILRCMHESPPLELDPKINGIAQDYAGILAAEGRFGHGGGFKVGGENLFVSSANTNYYPSLEDVAKTMVSASNAFYSEVQYYNSFWDQTGVTGHFTALVWKNTKRLGLGFSAFKRFDYKSQVYYVTVNVVANYYPAGNYPDEAAHLENVVPKPTKTEAECRREIFRKSGSAGHRKLSIVVAGLPLLLMLLSL